MQRSELLVELDGQVALGEPYREGIDIKIYTSSSDLCCTGQMDNSQTTFICVNIKWYKIYCNKTRGEPEKRGVPITSIRVDTLLDLGVQHRQTGQN